MNRDIWERIPGATPEELARSVLGMDKKKKQMKEYYLEPATHRIHEKDKCVATQSVISLISLPKSSSLGQATDAARIDRNDSRIRPCITCLESKG